MANTSSRSQFKGNEQKRADLSISEQKTSKSLVEPCGSERPARKVLCQGKKGHKGSCFAVIYWEDE